MILEQYSDHIFVVFTDSCNQRGVAILLAKRKKVMSIRWKPLLITHLNTVSHRFAKIFHSVFR